MTTMVSRKWSAKVRGQIPSPCFAVPFHLQSPNKHKVLICVSSMDISSKNQWGVHSCWLTLVKGTEGSPLSWKTTLPQKRSKLHCQMRSSHCLSLPSPEAEHAVVQLYATWNTSQSLFYFEVSSCHLETEWNKKNHIADRSTNLD